MNDIIDGLAAAIAGNGARLAFGVTGSGPSWSLITRLEELGVHYLPTCHEAAAALMAGAAARTTGVVTPSISIKGPGLANMLPGIIANGYENAPALSISEAYGSDAPASRMHKRLDHSAVLRSVVKQHIGAGHLDRDLSTLFCTAQAEIPGPVHVDLADTAAPPALPPSLPVAPSAVDVQRVLDAIVSAARPAVIAGSLALRRAWRTQLATLRVPVFTTAAGKGAIPEDLPAAAGIFTGDGRDLAPETAVLASADLIVGIGLRNAEILSLQFQGTPLVIVDEVDAYVAGIEPEARLVGADAQCIASVLDAVAEHSWGIDLIARAGSRLVETLSRAGWLPARCFHHVDRLEDPHALVLDTGSFCTVGEHVWTARAGRTFLGSSNGRFMGVSVPSAIGLALARPGLPVVCVAGDGGMVAYAPELRLALAERLPLCIVYMTDGRYGSIAAAMPAGSRSERAITLPGRAWWRTVETWGWNAQPVAAEPEFVAALEAWDRSTPLFLEAAFDPARYAAMTQDLR
ncbi:MAG TPA: thiamine pyrophosphate-dependent enzyme [Longimicrobiales bacterium]|nr:thiamine pyrophosphate-dependent enzyme [Longimicrobiales bacterium]